MEDATHSLSMTIDGEPVQGRSSLEIIDPAEGSVFARCTSAGAAELDLAVRAARRALAGWKALPWDSRRACVFLLAETLRAHKQELAELLTREQGKPLEQSLAEIERGASQSEGLARIPVLPERLVEEPGRVIDLQYRPLGVVGIITPWNAPINLALGPLVSAVYTGNTVVLKPSPLAPLATLRLGELLRPVFPRGVVNVVAGDDELGRLMSSHPQLDKISFTGSVESGKDVLRRSAGNLKRVTLELGGNDPAIVLEDVDVESIAPSIFFAAFVNSGQVCMAIKRLYVHTKVYDTMCAALVREAARQQLGPGLDPSTTLGPLQNRAQYERVLWLVEDAVRRGAHVIAGGRAAVRPGYFIEPTLVTGVDESFPLVAEEQFGPVLPILPFDHEDEAVRRANDTRFGLSASVWTSDLDRGRRVAAQLEAGTVWVNQHRSTSAVVPFGGAKESGLGCQYSLLGLKGFMQQRVVSISG